jgi:ADP-dependent NAD(P)H-hydrate dehydratase / NAD(P)H-hydrate epimerase
MHPVVTAAEMRDADAAAQQTVGLETLIARAGFAVARHAVALLGGAYGREVVVVAGRGHNGDDGRVAAALLHRRGARVHVMPPDTAVLPRCDLVIDAAFGTGFRGEYTPPTSDPSTPILAVDLSSGLDADTGIAHGAPFATATVTFAALKAGLLVGDGPARSGSVEIADIGLPIGEHHAALIDDADLAAIPPRRRDGHKWDAAVYVVAGSPGMDGAAALVASAALHTGAGMVWLASPGVTATTSAALEAVSRTLPAGDFSDALLADVSRFRCLVLGPGLGTGPETHAAILQVLERAPVPVVLDADGLNALGPIGDVAALLARRTEPVILTPHEGEFVRLFGAPIGDDRIGATRALAARANATVLLKGSTTIVASPDGEVLFAAAGSVRLSTGGTGDVLSGVIGALVARGLEAPLAAAIGAHVHGRAAALAPGVLVAGDLPALIAEELGPTLQ